MNTFDTKDKDQELYSVWAAEPSKQNLHALIKQLHPIIYSEVRRQSGTLPEAALSAEAKKWAVKAIKSYDPSKGAALATHATNYLAKVRRVNYQYQNAARLPENLHLKFSEFRNVISHLTDSLNREPTDEEIADEIGWKKAEVTKFKGNLYSDLTESASLHPTEITQYSDADLRMAHLMAQLTPDEKIIMEYSGKISAPELAAKLGVNLSRYNYLKSKLVAKVQSLKTDVGL